jgi:hypothetical protein
MAGLSRISLNSEHERAYSCNYQTDEWTAERISEAGVLIWKKTHGTWRSFSSSFKVCFT